MTEACERVVLGALAGSGPLRAAAERVCAETNLRKNSPFGSAVTEDLARLAASLGESGRTPAQLIAASPGLDREAARFALDAAKHEVAAALDALEDALRGAPSGTLTPEAREGLVLLRGRALPLLLQAAPGELQEAWALLEVSKRWLPKKTKSAHGQAAGALREALKSLEGADADVRACALSRDLAALAEEALAQTRAEKARLRALEFDDLTRLAGALLEHHPSVRRAEKERIEALLIDEFQDTSRAQLALCGWLAEERAAEGTAPAGSGLPGARAIEPGLLYLVGDRKQSI